MNKKLIFTLISGLVSTQAFAEINLDLNPVVVTATRSAQNSFDLPVSIDAVDGETIRDNRLGANLSEVAPRIPGVVINNRYNAAQELAISSRGFGARSLFGVKGVRIYADGIPLTTSDGQGQLGSINLDTVGSVEFMRGPFSALYGNSSGGVVQAFTRDGAKDPTLTGGFSVGSYNTKKESLTYEGESGQLNYILNASQISSDGYRDHSEYRKNSYNAKVTYKANEDTKLTFVANYMEQPYTQDPLTLSPTQFKLDPKQAGSQDAYNQRTRVYKEQTLGGVTLDHNISDTDSLKAMVYYGRRNNLQFVTTYASQISRDYGGFDFKWQHKADIFARPAVFTAGITYDEMEDDRRRYSVTTTGVKGNKKALTRNEIQKAHNFDQYAQLTYDPTDRLFLVAGLRHTRVNIDVNDKVTSPSDDSGSVSFSNTSPVVGAVFKLAPTMNLYANYGTGFETPTFSEMTYVETTNNTGPNLGLTPSKSKNYEVGVKAFVTDNTRVNLALFKIDTKDEIVVDTYNAGAKTTKYKSIADTERKGVELSVDSKLPYNFNFYGAYTLMDAKFKRGFCASDCSDPASQQVYSGNKIPATYKSTTYSELSWRYAPYGFSAALEAIYFSSTNAYDSNWATYRADAYTLFNMRAGLTQNITNWKFSEFVRVENLGDKSYVSNVKVNTDTPFEPGPTRNYTVGISASYMFK